MQLRTDVDVDSNEVADRKTMSFTNNETYIVKNIKIYNQQNN